MTSLKESSINEPALETLTVKPEQSAPSAPIDGLAELRALETELQGGRSGAAQSGSKSDNDSGRPDSGTVSGAGPGDVRKRRKFKKVPPENTIRLTIRQYWRFRDWMARRSLGLPEEFAGVFIQGKDSVLVEPLVEPVIGCLDSYLPEEWVVFIEDKSPILMLLLAIFEAEQVFSGAVNQAKLESKSTSTPKEQATAEPERVKMPSLNETVGKAARVNL